MTIDTMLARNVLAVSNVKPGARRVVYRVKGEPGLALVVHPSGRKTWFARYQLGTGAARRQTYHEIGNADVVALADACRRNDEIRSELHDGADPAAERVAERSAPTFYQLVERWLDFKSRQTRGNSASHRNAIRQMIGQPLPGAKRRSTPNRGLPKWFLAMKAPEITRADVTRVLEAEAKRGATIQVNRRQAMISSALSWGLAEGVLEVNVAHGIRRRFEENVRYRRFSAGELRALWAGINTVGGEPGTKIAIRLCIALGQRPNEICSLKRAKVSLDSLQPMATIEKGTSKNRVEHNIPLPALAVELLRDAVALAKESPYVFPSVMGKPLTPKALGKALHRARAKDGTLFGIADAELYDSKTTIASFLGDASYTNDQVGILFNHLSATKGSVTGRSYNHSSYMPLKLELTKRWADHLDVVLGRTVAADNVVKLDARRENVGG